jgi:hypothetical protein
MKTYAGFGLIGLAGLLLSGCPIYDTTNCYSDYDCPSNAYCSENNECIPYPVYGAGGSGGTSNQVPCTHPEQCGVNSVCGADGTCHTGDCSFSGCVSGYKCTLDAQNLFVCVPSSTGKGGSAGAGGSLPDGGAGAAGEPDGGGGTAGADASVPVYCGNPKDCPTGQTCTPEGVCETGSCTSLGCVNGYVCADDGTACVPTNPAACMLDGDCGFMGTGYKCVNGTCTAPDKLCTDKTQCPGLANCVDGKCVASCSADAGASCATGYVCDAVLGVCTPPASGCSVTSDCDSATLVCVAGACVPECGAGGTCPTGQVCVANGCIPDQQPKFDCTVDGTQDVCAASSICLHHHCYISCEGANANVCDFNPPELSLCKTVTTSSGEHNICGSNSNLGSECDPTLGPACADGKFCIDGFCK